MIPQCRLNVHVAFAVQLVRTTTGNVFGGTLRYYNFLRVTKQGLLAFTLQSAVEINVKKSVDF